MVDVICEGCGKSFSIKRSRLERGPARNCSVACRLRGQYKQSNKPEVDGALERETGEARRMRAAGASWESIGRRFKRGKEFFQCHLVPGFRERMQRRKDGWRAEDIAKKRAKLEMFAARPVDLPESVVAEIRRQHAAGIRPTSIPAVLSVRGITHKAVTAVLEGR
jgi:hypothetical protein